MYRELTVVDKSEYNKLVSHPLQSWQWGEFREETGVKVVRVGLFDKDNLTDGFQLTFHQIPFTNYSVGYFPKGELPTTEMLTALTEVGEKHNAVFIKLEPNVISSVIPSEVEESLLSTTVEKDLSMRQAPPDLVEMTKKEKLNLIQSSRPLFTKYTFYIDLTKSEEELIKSFESKTRYNIRLAEKHGVTIQEENTQEAFDRYLELTQETTKRQGFYAHTEEYHRLMWQCLNQSGKSKSDSARKFTIHNSQFSIHLLTARYQGKILVTWILFLFNNVLYYPYGASSQEFKNVMASNLMMWEAIRWGKSHGARTFDLWGTPGPDPKPTDDYYGFHKFKLGYHPQLVEFIGTYDLIFKQPQYVIFQILDKFRWILLRLKAKLV